MKRFRVLAVILAVLMLPISLLVGCNNTTPGDSDACADGNHSWGSWIRVQERSCTTDSIRIRLCEKCGVQEEERREAYGHSFDENAGFVSDNNATCTEDGTRSKRCLLCSYRETEADPGSALGHTFILYKPSEDGFTETAMCIKCNAATDTRLLGLTIDFEGDRSHLSYSAFEVYTGELEDAYEYATEGDNTYLSISRPAGTIVGGGAFGVILTPRADILKGGNEITTPSYVVEFDVRIDRDNTGDLVLLSGTKQNITETFIKYNSGNGTIESNLGTVYELEDEDFGAWLRIAAVLNDGTKKYDIYVDNNLYATGLDYSAADGYYMGYDLDNLTIAMVPDETASSVDVDNITLYLGRIPNGEIGTAEPGYAVYVTTNGDKIVYKVPVEGCEHSYSSAVVAPTCVTTGYTIETCSVCGGQVISNEVAPTGHTFEFDHTIEATCITPGLESSVCTVCGARDAKEVTPALGHTLDETSPDCVVTVPTCTEAGYTTGPCVRCGVETTGANTAALGHEIDPATAETTDPSCIADGSTTGKCIRCQIDMTVDVKPALGHTCANPTVVPVSCTTAGYNDCVCDVCGTQYKDKEIPALGHSMVSEITTNSEGVAEIHSYCSRCHDESVETYKPVSGEIPPTPDEMLAAIGDNSMIQETSYNFENLTPGVYGTLDNYDQASGIEQFVSRYGALEIKRMRTGSYAEWIYSPANSPNGKNLHTYWRLNPPGGKSEEGRTYVIDFSLRRTEGEEEVLPFNVGIEDRTKKHHSGNLGSNFVNINADGTITLGNSASTRPPVATLKEEVWTRISIVVHPNVDAAATYDLYIDGVLVGSQMLALSGEPNRKGFDQTTFVAFNVADQNVNVSTRRVDIDEIYVYYADLPVYVRDISMRNGSLMNFADVSSNTTTEIEGVTYSYLEKNALGVGVDFNGKDHTLFYIDNFDGETGLSIVKNESVPNVYPETGNDSHITSWGYQIFSSTLLEADIRLNEGTDMTGWFTIFQGRRQVGEASASQTFLTYENGWFVAGNGDKLLEVEQGKWYTVAVVVSEARECYDVYIDGYMYREALPFTAANYTGNYSAGVAYKFMNLSASDVDLSVKEINFQGSAQVPTLNLGKYETVYVETLIPSVGTTNVLSFYEDYNYTYLYSASADWVGKEIFTESDGKSYLSISNTNKQTAGLDLVKIDSEGNMGDAAGEDAVWALRTGDWATNGAPSAFRYLSGVPYVGSGYYDLSAYDKIKLTFYVEKANDYPAMIQIASDPDPSNSNKTGYFGYYLTFNETGWKTFEFDLTEDLDTSNYNPNWNLIANISLTVTGWNNGDGKGNAKDGTVVYIASIDLIDSDEGEINKTTVGSYLLDDTLCSDGEHSLDGGTSVAPSLHVDGYTLYSCTKCDYIEIKQDVGTAINHDDSMYVRDEANYKAPTCEADGENYYKLECPICGTTTYREIIPRLGHDWAVVEGAENEEGYETVECTRDGCTRGQVLREIQTPEVTTHNLSAFQVVTEPTCYSAGRQVATCQDIGCSYKEEEVIPPLPHNTVENIIREASCGAAGEKLISCTNCDYSETVEIPALEHAWSGEMRIEPTYLSEGKIYRVCGNCGTEETISTIPALYDGTAGLTFIESDKENEVVINNYSGNDTDIVIPENYAGNTIVVGKDAFNGNKRITSVTIGEDVDIAPYSFENCTSLKSVVFEGDAYIPVNAFRGCTSLETITINGKLISVEVAAFMGCNAIKTVYYSGDKPTADYAGDFSAVNNGTFFDAEWVK